jgi:hypothetical protein
MLYIAAAPPEPGGGTAATLREQTPAPEWRRSLVDPRGAASQA